MDDGPRKLWGGSTAKIRRWKSEEGAASARFALWRPLILYRQVSGTAEARPGDSDRKAGRREARTSAMKRNPSKRGQSQVLDYSNHLLG